MRWPWPRRARASDTRWVVLDVESSGLNPARDRLLAVAAVALRFEGARAWIDANDGFEALLQQPLDVDTPDNANILIHGLGLAAQRAGEPPAQALQAFHDWAGSAPRLGFHVGFDRAIIERARALHAPPRRHTPAARWLDIEALAAISHPEVAAKALDDWLQHFDIPCAARHQAAADTLATAELLLRLWPALWRAGARDFTGCARLVAGRRWLVG